MRVAVFGSREYQHLDDVRVFVDALVAKYPDVVVVSGGAKGVDQAAESAALQAGAKVISYRPTKDYAVERWELGTQTPHVTTLGPEHPTFDDYASAAIYRDALIAEDADRGVGFWNGKSRGTKITEDFFVRWNDKPCVLYSDKDRFCASAS